MQTYEYSIETTYGDYMHPVVVRRSLEEGVEIAYDAIDYLEAESAGLNLETFFTYYKEYLNNYYQSLTTMAEETAFDQSFSHMDVSNATDYFVFFMKRKWDMDA